MNNGNSENPYIVLTGRGPCVAGTRLTIYAIMDELKDRSPDYVQGWYRLTDEVWAGVMRYLTENKEELERKFEEVMRQAEEERIYWTERNKDRANLPPSPPAHEGIALAREKLAAIKEKKAMEELARRQSEAPENINAQNGLSR